MNHDEVFMKSALELAQKAASELEVPVGAVVTFENQIVGRGYNRREGDRNPLGHAEILALAEAAKHLGRWRLTGCSLYVTLEPCVMCAGAIVNSRVDRVIYGAKDPKAGAVESLYQILGDSRLNHRPLVDSGVLAEDCSKILTEFFKNRRAL